jgi:Hypothetical glycosyl hydrolase family 15
MVMRALRLAAAMLLGALLMATPAVALRPIPSTRSAIHVWDDQLPDDMTSAQINFVARHVDGTQKVSLQTAKRLRARNARFLILHYRLGIGDGPVSFRIGNRWATDYGSVRRHPSWFWHEDGKRVLNTQSDWYLMNPDSGWRRYWVRRVLYEARLLGDDGVFADSLSVPQYLGADNFSPALHYFVGEQTWTRRIDDFMRYAKNRLRGRLWLIPNAGSWITTRDRTDYATPNGVMIEGFAEPGDNSWYAVSDWQLQMNRALSLARHGHVVIAQTYPGASDVRGRMFALGSYLLTKGVRSFINLDVGIMPQWFPEYGIDLGSPLRPLPDSIARLRTRSGLYVRGFQHGLVLVNPGHSARTYAAAAGGRSITPHGGGVLPADASTSGWGLSSRRLSGPLTVGPESAAIILRSG